MLHLITGATGQDARLMNILAKSYGEPVLSLTRRSKEEIPLHIESDIGTSQVFYQFDYTEQSFYRILTRYPVANIFHFAGESRVSSINRKVAEFSYTSNLQILRNLLSAVKRVSNYESINILQMSSSEIFGGPVRDVPQVEETEPNPISEYGKSKLIEMNMCDKERKKYGLNLKTVIAYNHESSRRGNEYLTKKLAKVCASIYSSRPYAVEIGKLDSKRDWGSAIDYVEAIYKIAVDGKSDRYVLATGNQTSVRDLVSSFFSVIGISDWSNYVKSSDQFFRSYDPSHLVGNAARLKSELGWSPRRAISDWVQEMIEYELKTL